jgi:rsbT co-antagonist protein RsbR
VTVETDTRSIWATVLEEHRGEVVEQWTRIATANLRGRATAVEVRREVDDLYEALLGGLRTADQLKDEGFGELRAILAELSRNQARQGFSPSETARSVFALKDAVLSLMERRNDASLYRAFPALSTMLDDLGLFTFETFVHTRAAVIVDQTNQLMELSTPVVKLWDGIVAVPLVGTLDSARTQVVMEKLLQALVDTGSEHAIIDITGVPAVDTQVAQHLLKTVMAAKLMGAECIISGIRPQIAQTIVALGIEFGEIPTKASLADALVAALRQTGAELVKTRRKGV